jgi:predicted nucleic acid-binding protein
MVFPVMVLDSSFLVSLFRNVDDNNPKAIILFKEHAQSEMLLPETVFFETLTVLNYKNGISLAREAYEKLLSNSQIHFYPFSEEEKLGFLHEFFAAKGAMSVPDASVVYLARKMRCQVLAFDKNLLKHVGRERTGK